MTGPLARFRAWLGSLFGGEDADGAEDEEPGLQGGGPSVTHRDDRPLETPDVPPGTDPDVTAVDGAGAVDSEPAGADGDDATPPDSGPEAPPELDVEADETFEVFGPGSEDGETDVAPGDDVECAVCGTELDDPESACPLCGSTERRPA